MPESSEPSESPEQAATPADGRARLVRALVKPGAGQWVVGVLLAAVGLAAVVVMKTTSQADPYTNMRQEELINVMEGLTGTTERARREIADLEETRRNLAEDATAEQAALAQAKERVNALDILAGRVPVKGTGVRVTITPTDESTMYVPMIDLIQELRTAGAEAIAINGKVRVVAQTSFGASEGHMTINGEIIEAPYSVVAIGGSDMLTKGVSFRNGPKTQFEKLRATVTTTELEQVEISVTVPLEDAGTATGQTNQ